MQQHELISTLHDFINTRPQLDFRDYGDFSTYRQEQRSITADLLDARELLRIVSMYPSSIAYLRDELENGTGRLTAKFEGEKITLDYCVGQYFPTEYRKAVCRACASALFRFFRDNGCDNRSEILKAFKRATSSRRVLRYV